ncbi:MAG: FtsW/RodA/SpoVE family cell cycle protein [Lachnospiraceae bacterium]|nr:FtsW/RodA/SpoVE family cell cycle protein [Lachnospiraceae bacterium]
MKRRMQSDYYDYNLIAVIIILIGFGLVMLYSTTSYTASVRYGDDMYFFTKQLRNCVLAILLAVAISLFDYHLLWRLSQAVYGLSIFCMILVRFVGSSSHGSQRWLRIGSIQFQPAEMAKIAVIVYLPMLIVSMGKSYRKTIRGPLIVGGLGLVQAAAAYFLTDNLSTAIIIAIISFVIVFVAHPRTAGFLLAVGVLFGIAALYVFYVAAGGGSGSFRDQRILVWLHPENYARSGGWQILQGLYALGSGGIFGKGLGNSTQKLGALPEAQNDMIFSIICEELGVVGGVIIVLLFIYLLYRLFFIAQNAPDLYGSLMVSGVFAHIAAQVILNICVALNLIPTTGVTLPFVSYGGTSVLFLMMEMAIALSVSRRIRFRQKERDMWGDLVHTA